MRKYTVQETHQLLREAAIYVDETGGYRVEYVDDLAADADGNLYANVMMRDEETDEQESFDITEIDLSRPDVLVYGLVQLNV